MGSSSAMARRLFYAFLLFYGVLTSHSQSTTVTCDFEQGNLCTWNSNDGLQRWQLGSGLVGAGTYALNGTDYGQRFVYVDSNTLPSPKQATSLYTSNQPAVKSDLTFYYRTNGYGVISLDLFIDTTTERYLLWSDPTRRPQWRLAKVQVCIEEEYKLTFEAKFFSKGFLVALDDIELASEQGLKLPASECILPDPLTTAEPTVTPAVPTQQILLTATCNFDTGLCPLWDGRAGVTADGEWESAYENFTTGVWAPLEGPKNGDGYVFARGIFKRSELSTGMISLTPSSAEFLYGQVTFWFNFYNITPLPAESIAPYQFKVISVSTADEHEEVVGSKEDTLTSNGWISWTLDFCLIESSYLKFVLLNPPHQLNFAIDEVLSVQVENGSTTLCREVSTSKPAPDISVAPLPSLPDCLQWEAISSLSCDFDNGMCEGWLTPNGSYPFDCHTEGPIGVGSLVINEPHKGVGFAATSCSFNLPVLTDITSALQLPNITALASPSMYRRISFWYVFVNIRGDNRNMQLLKYTTPSAKETIWAVTDGQSTIWRYAEVNFEGAECVTLLFQVDHNKCSSPTALDSVLVEQVTDTPTTCTTTVATELSTTNTATVILALNETSTMSTTTVIQTPGTSTTAIAQTSTGGTTTLVSAVTETSSPSTTAVAQTSTGGTTAVVSAVTETSSPSTTAVAQTSTGGTTAVVSAVTETSTTEPTTTFQPVTERPPPVKPTTAVPSKSELSKSDKILIGVGSAAGVIVLIAVFILLCTMCKKRTKEDNQARQHHEVMRLKTRTTRSDAAPVSASRTKISDDSVRVSKKKFDSDSLENAVPSSF